MNLQEHVYSVLVVSRTNSFNKSIANMLPPSKYAPVVFSSGVSEARRHTADRSFDFIIINAPLPDEDGIGFSIDCCLSQTAVVLLFVGGDIYEKVRSKVVRHGVFILPKPTSGSTVKQALCWMESARERLRKLEKKTLSITDRMEEIRLVNRAKWLLISELNMTEPEAHHYIEKSAMDNCVSKRTVAEGIIKNYKQEKRV